MQYEYFGMFNVTPIHLANFNTATNLKLPKKQNPEETTQENRRNEKRYIKYKIPQIRDE